MLYLLRVLTCTVLDPVLVLNVALVWSASAQTSVHVYEGADALLPCTHPEGPPPSDASVYWKDEQENQALTIHKHKDDPRNQSPEYRDRVRSFPHLYKSGNFSLVLMKVKESDSGVFECYIKPDEFQKKVRLNVTRKLGSPGSELTELTELTGSEGGRSGPSDGGSVVAPHLLLHLPLLLSLCL